MPGVCVRDWVIIISLCDMNAIGEEVPGVSCVVWEMPWIDVYLINRHHNGIIKFYDCQLPERELLYQFSPLIIILRLATFSKHSVTIRYPINIWQVSPQLRCSDTCQMWTRFSGSIRGFSKDKRPYGWNNKANKSETNHIWINKQPGCVNKELLEKYITMAHYDLIWANN